MAILTQEKLLRLPQVRERVTLSTAKIYEMMAKGEFPRPVKISERNVAWPASAVQRWIDEKIAAADA